ncbi:hypothetical protein ACJJTC_010647 [Scirpophaga incertulas]
MATKPVSKEDDSFIILGTSPGTSLDVKFGDASGDVSGENHIEDALKDLSPEASVAYKAQCQLGDCPSPPSMMTASAMVTDDTTTEELQRRFGKLLDENLILKESLKKNNESIKEQFVMIMSFQEDMMKTHQLHKEKFNETRELVEKLRQDNKQLKEELSLREAEKATAKSGPSSGLEFVTSPDDDTIYKLTAQLELVERQRREVLVDNEKLTWQKESLEHIVDATTKECAELKIKVQQLELEDKLGSLRGELKAAQLKIMELENVKLEYIKHKSSVADTVRMYKEQLLELNKMLKEAQQTKIQNTNVEALTSALLARAEEIKSLKEELKLVREEKDDKDLLKAQLDLYKSDFEAEREARQKMASEKETILADMRTLQRKCKEQNDLIDIIKGIEPSLYSTALTLSTNAASSNQSPASLSAAAETAGVTRPASNGAIKKTIYTCPKCRKFKSNEEVVIQEHLDFCLDQEDTCSPF